MILSKCCPEINEDEKLSAVRARSIRYCAEEAALLGNDDVTLLPLPPTAEPFGPIPHTAVVKMSKTG